MLYPGVVGVPLDLSDIYRHGFTFGSHLRSELPAAEAIWSPGKEIFEIGDSGGFICEGDGSECGPSDEFISIVLSRIREGKVLVITFPKEDLEGRAVGQFGQAQLSFFYELARKLSKALEIFSSGAPSYHARNLQSVGEDYNLDGEPLGFRTEFHRSFPLHHDVALCFRNGSERIYRPSLATITAWGKPGENRRNISNLFFDSAKFKELGFPELKGDLMTATAPGFYCLDRARTRQAYEQNSLAFAVDIPPGSITVFTNRGLAHGSDYGDYDAMRPLNRNLKSQERGWADVQERDKLPIEVILL